MAGEYNLTYTGAEVNAAVGNVKDMTNSGGSSSIRLGVDAGATGQQTRAIAIGQGTGSASQGPYAVALGQAAGNDSQGERATALGKSAGETEQGDSACALGVSAGKTNQSSYAVAVGASAGETGQGGSGIAMGPFAARTNQSEKAIAIGSYCGQNNQGAYSVAMGQLAAESNQSSYAVAVGASAGQTGQGERSVAIGPDAGATSMGKRAICIGYGAGKVSAPEYTITIGAGSDSTSTPPPASAYALKIGQSNYSVQIGDGNVQSVSDRRDKYDIRDLDAGLQFVNALKPKLYKYDIRELYEEQREITEMQTVTDENGYTHQEEVVVGYETIKHTPDGSKAGKRDHAGLIAQDVKETIDAFGIDFALFRDESINATPEHKDRAKDKLALCYQELIPVLVRAVQELSAEVDKLKGDVNGTESN